MKKVLVAAAVLVSSLSFAQQKTVEELKAEKAKLTTELGGLKSKITAIDGQLSKLDKGWKFGTMGTIGANFSGFNNWFSNPIKNSQTANIGVVVNGFATLKENQYFWRNTGSINLGWTKIDNLDTDTDSKDYKQTSDVLNINSLFGYNLTPTLAASALAEYRTTLIENFNNPGFLDFGIGVTWTPVSELLVVVHPLNYNFVFSDSETSYESSLGSKVMAEYNKNFSGFKFRSNLTAFLSYTEPKDLSNWTWVNSLGFNLWKGIGVGLETGLRQNKQENYNATGGEAKWGNLSNSENLLQSYWLVGLSYSL